MVIFIEHVVTVVTVSMVKVVIVAGLTCKFCYGIVAIVIVLMVT